MEIGHGHCWGASMSDVDVQNERFYVKNTHRQRNKDSGDHTCMHIRVRAPSYVRLGDRCLQDHQAGTPTKLGVDST